MNNLKIKNVRFELIGSSLKGYKEVQVIFDYEDKTYKYFIFVEERKNINYIKQAKKEFYKDLKSGKVIKNLKLSSISSGRPWLTIGVGIAGTVTAVLASLFTWKYVTNTQTKPKEEIYHTVTFMEDDKVAETIKVANGELCPQPKRIVHGIFSSVNWLTNPDIPEPFDFNTPIVCDTKLYANMRIELHKYVSETYSGHIKTFSLDQAKETIAYYPEDYTLKFCLDLSMVDLGEYYVGTGFGIRGGWQPYFMFPTLWIGSEKLINGVDYIETGETEIEWIRKIGKSNDMFYIDCPKNDGASGNIRYLIDIVTTWEIYWDPEEPGLFAGNFTR